MDDINQNINLNEYALALKNMEERYKEVTLMIEGKQVYTTKKHVRVSIFDHSRPLYTYHEAGFTEIQDAVKSAVSAKRNWEALEFSQRAEYFDQLVDLLSGSRNIPIVTSSILAQGKILKEARRDLDEGLANLKWIANHVREVKSSVKKETFSHQHDYQFQPLDGVVLGVSNGISINKTLSMIAEILITGNTLIWYSTPENAYLDYQIMKAFNDTHFPAGVINFITGDFNRVIPVTLDHFDLNNVIFSGSPSQYKELWHFVLDNQEQFSFIPNINADIDGKNFLFAHEKCDVDSLAVTLLEGAFLFQGQYNTSLSKAFVPRSILKQLTQIMTTFLKSIKMGDVRDFSRQFGPVQTISTFEKVKEVFKEVLVHPKVELLSGGRLFKKGGYYIEPTVLCTSDFSFNVYLDDIRAPILTMVTYEPKDYSEAMKQSIASVPNANTVSVFSNDPYVTGQAVNHYQQYAKQIVVNDIIKSSLYEQNPLGGDNITPITNPYGIHSRLVRWLKVSPIFENFIPINKLTWL